LSSQAPPEGVLGKNKARIQQGESLAGCTGKILAEPGNDPYPKRKGDKTKTTGEDKIHKRQTTKPSGRNVAKGEHRNKRAKRAEQKP